jgi:hypothetical protein
VISNSTTDAGLAPHVGGFEIESVLGRGPRGTVYVATQTGLGRRVALKVYPARGAAGVPGAAWPEHPGVARLHAAGAAGPGGFTASQLAAGGSLAARLQDGDIAREDALAVCDQVAATLAALGVAHGALGAGNVLLDAAGRALLCDFGMPGVEATADADRRALAELRARCRRLPTRGERRRRRRVVVGAGAVVAAGAALVAIAVMGGDRPSTPSPLPGAQVLGSALAGATPTTLGCDGLPPNGSAPGCTIVQVRRDGRTAAFPAGGVIRRWALRGARGGVTLQVVRRLPTGRYITVRHSQTEQAAVDGVRAFPADVAVRRGDFPAVALEPGAGVGTEPHARGAATLRFVGALRYGPPRRPREPTATALDRAVELRVEFAAGARPRPTPALAGTAARDAPAGRRLAAGELEFSGGRVRTVAVVVLRDRVAVDLLRGSTRLQRVDVVGADPRGTLVSFDHASVAAIGPLVVWRNPGGRELVRDYRARADRLEPID